MTPQKRTHHLPEEERPSDAPQEQPVSETPAEQALEHDQIASQPQPDPDGEFPEGQIPSFPVDNVPGGPEFDFPHLKSDKTEFEMPLPSRLAEDEPIRLPGSRRRRRQNRLMIRPDVSELGERLESMARRAAPTFDFFFFSILAGAILGLGYMLDAPAILLFGILVSPILVPWVGVALGAAAGETRFLGQTLGGFLTALGMVFLTGILAGLAIRLWMPVTTDQAFLHARFWVPDLLLMAVGTVVLTVSFIQSEEKPLLASLMVAYEIYLPVSAAGFGFGSGVQGLGLQGLVVLLVHLAISIILALIVFYYMGFRPLEISGYALAGLVVVVLAVVAGYGIIMLDNVRGNRASATSSAPTLTLAPSFAAQATFTPRATFPPTPTRLLITATPGVTPSPTLLPTPVYGHIHSPPPGDGAVVRIEPNGAPITTVQNDYLVILLPDLPVTVNNVVWVRIKVMASSREIIGWVQLSLILTATPSGPSTPAVTATTRPASP